MNKMSYLLMLGLLYLTAASPLFGADIPGLLQPKENIEWQGGRLTQENRAVRLRGNTVKAELPAVSKDGMLLEFWLKVQEWEGDGGPVLRLTGARTDILIEKAASAPVLRVLFQGKPFGEYPVDHWTAPMDWLKKDDVRPWHHVALAFGNGRVTAFVDGFRLGEAQTAGVTGESLALTLSAPGVLVFDELRWLPYEFQDAKTFRTRYLQLYRNIPAVDQQTVAVPTLKDDPDAARFLETGTLQGATVIPMFLSLRKENGWPSLIQERATVAIGRRGDRLYLAFRSPYEGTLAGQKTGKRDFGFWPHEAFEVFIEPPWTGVTEYVQLVGTAHGDQCDLQLMNAAWNGVWDWQARILDNEWRGLMVVDLKQSGMPVPGHGDIWGFNIFNLRANLAWSWSQRFHDTAAFGRMVFLDDAPQLLPGYPQIADGKLKLAVRAEGGAKHFPLKARIERFVPDNSIPVAQAEEILKAPSGEITLEIPYDGTSSGLFTLAVTDQAGQTLYYQSFALPAITSGPRELVEAKADENASSQEQLPEWPAEILGKTLQESREWFGNKVGKRDGVPHYLEPVTVADGKVKIWNRTYAFSDTLFPRQITSNGKDLLAAPVSLEIKTGKRAVSLGQAKTTVVSQTPREAVIEAQAVAEGVRFQTRGTISFDGLAWYELTISPVDGPVDVSSLELHVPMPRRQAKLFNITSSESGFPPGSDSGKIPDQPLVLDFLREVVWLGSPREGLTWIAEDLRDWPLRNRDGIQIIEPGKDRVTLRVKLADAFTLREPVTWRFGMEATPLRPRGKDFRSRADRDKVRWSWFWGEGDYYPFHDDPTMARSIIEKERKEGREVMPASSVYYFGEYRFGIPPKPFPEHPNGGMMFPENVLFSDFWNAMEPPFTGVPPEILRKVQVAEGEGWKKTRSQPTGQFRYNPASSFQDFYLWKLDRAVKETGLGAIYLDQTMMQVRNSLSGAGYHDARGNRVFSVPLLGMRSMLERMQNVFEDAHGKSFIRWHSSNQLVVPVFPYIDIFWDGENYGQSRSKVYEFYSKLLTPEKLQVQHSGLPFGFIPDLLPRHEERYAPTPASTRDMLGLLMIHDSHVWDAQNAHTDIIRSVMRRWMDFPYTEAKTFYYWDEDKPVSINHREVFPILHVTPRRGRMILFNWSDKPVNASAAFSGGVKIQSATDAETGAPVPSAPDSLSLLLPPRDFRMIDFTRK